MTVTDQQQEMILAVVKRFLNLRQSTPRRDLLRKFKNIKELDALVSRGFLYQSGDETYVPTPLAFDRSGDAECTTRAKQAVERTLWTLQNLDEAYPEKESVFSQEEFLSHAARMYDPKPNEADLLLGLYLSTHLGIFRQWGCDATDVTPNQFRVDESIIMIDPAQMWDEHINRRDQASQVVPGLNEEAIAAKSLRAAVLPIGNYDYHPEIERVSGQLFRDGNFRQAVLDAFIHVIATVKERTALTNRQGVPYEGDDLMNNAFSPDKQVPPVQFNPLRNTADKDEQRGIWNLFRGVVGLRNYKAHIVSAFDDPHRAHEYLALASLLMRLLDMATYNSPQPQPAVPASPAVKRFKAERILVIHGNAGPGVPILFTGREASAHDQTMLVLSSLVTVANHVQQPVTIAAKRLVIDGSEWPTKALFFQLRKESPPAKRRAITLSGYNSEEFKFNLILPLPSDPKGRSGVIEFQIDDRDEPFSADVQFP